MGKKVIQAIWPSLFGVVAVRRATRQISILNEAMTLFPGDVIITGTPIGVGMTRNPLLFMKHGDVCEVEIELIGILRNKVGDE